MNSFLSIIAGLVEPQGLKCGLDLGHARGRVINRYLRTNRFRLVIARGCKPGWNKD